MSNAFVVKSKKIHEEEEDGNFLSNPITIFHGLLIKAKERNEKKIR